jgi:hypothetical protein
LFSPQLALSLVLEPEKEYYSTSWSPGSTPKAVRQNVGAAILQKSVNVALSLFCWFHLLHFRHSDIFSKIKGFSSGLISSEVLYFAISPP